jgi:hypothetical protein
MVRTSPHGVSAADWNGRVTSDDGRPTPVAGRRRTSRPDRDDLRQLVDDQAALRRVATLVAGGAGALEVFAAVTAEVGQPLQSVPSTSTTRETLRDLALRLLQERGPGALRIRDLAAATERSTMGVFTHFGSSKGCWSSSTCTALNA